MLRGVVMKNLSFEILKRNVFLGPVDGSRRLPRVRGIRGNQDTILVGYVGKQGCFSATLVGGAVEIALYSDDPVSVARGLADGTHADAEFHKVPACPGWGFGAIHLLKDYLKG